MDSLFSVGTGGGAEMGRKPAALRSLTLVVSQPEVSESEKAVVAKALSWCLRMGLEYTFAYDPEGALKSSRGAIAELVRKECPEVDFSTASGWTALTGGADEGKEREKEGQMIHFLSREDSLAPLLHAASPSKMQGKVVGSYRGLEDVDQYWSTDLSIEKLKKEISAMYGKVAVLEPDVVCVAGPVFSLAFSPPWHSRFSEIFYLGPLHTLNFDYFCFTLGRFWRTHQRFGV